jgi:hypothetical protein
MFAAYVETQLKANRRINAPFVAIRKQNSSKQHNLSFLF